jgi:branched-chain amino acid transport system permease protein
MNLGAPTSHSTTSPRTSPSHATRMAWRALVALALLVGLYALHRVLDHFVMEYVVRVVMLAGIYAISAVGLNLILGTAGQFSLGHIGFMAVGAYTAALTTVSLEPMLGSGSVGFAAGLLVGVVCAAGAGFLVGAPSLRLRGDYLAVVTLGFAEAIRLFFNNLHAVGGSRGYSGGKPLGLPLHTNVFVVYACLALVVLLTRRLTFSSYGRALQAIEHDEVAAESMGIPTARLKVIAFVMSAAMAGLAGGLFAHMQSTIRPDDFRLERSIDILVMVVLGGLGSITGSIAGALLVTAGLELMREVQQYRMVAYALLLIVIIAVRPEGVLGRKDVTRIRTWWASKRGVRPSSPEAWKVRNADS